MAKYTADAEKLLDLVGGKGNISAVTHCMTRMRFVLVDPDRQTSPRSRSSPAPRARSRKPASSR